MTQSPRSGKLFAILMLALLAMVSFTSTSKAQEILSFTATEDVFVRSNLPTNNYSPAPYLRVRSGSQGDQIAFIKFDLNGIGRNSIKKATLRLFVIETGVGGTVFPVSSKFGDSELPWDELSMTYESAPPIINDALSTLGRVTLGETIEFDVTSAVTVDGKRSFAIVSTVNDLVRYSSKEGVQAPELIIELGPPIPFPNITGFEPRSGVVGSLVAVTGENFLGVRDVQLNGVSVDSFAVDSASLLRFFVPDSATSGKIRIVTEFGEAESEGDFLLAFPPTITSFVPTQGPPGTEVTILGTNLRGLADILFNGDSAAYFEADSDSQVRAIVPGAASTGPLTVENAAGADATVDNFTVTLPPSMFTLNPIHDAFVRSARPTNNYGANVDLRVRQPHSDSVFSFIKFRVLGVGSGIKSAVLRLTVNDGSVDGGKLFRVSNNYAGTTTPWQESGLLFTNAPPITGEPLANMGSVDDGETIEIDMTEIITGDGEYSFAIRNAANDAVTYGSNNGPNPAELVIETNILDIILPKIATFSPDAAPVGTEVTIRGRNLQEATGVAFNGINASDFIIDGPTQIRAKVPGGASTGKITVTDPDGLGTSEEDFIVVSQPTIVSFDPLQGPPGTEVTINGANLAGLSQVRFDGSPAASFQVDSDSRLRARVPFGASTGLIELSNAAGAATSVAQFIVTELPRDISLAPIEDSFVRSSRPDKVYGLADELRVRRSSSAEYITYLKFQVTGLGASISKARLRLFVIDGSDQGGSLYLTSNSFRGSNTAWNENEITFDNAPEVSSNPLFAIGDVTVGETVEFDVSDLVTGDGTYTFALKNKSSDLANYSSKEGVQSPELFIETIAGGDNPGDDDDPGDDGNDDDEPVDPDAPVVTSFDPQVGAPGMVVTITGSNFTSVTGVAFNETATISFIADSPSRIRATVPFGTTTGKVSVTNSAGRGNSQQEFVIPGPPTISSFLPNEGEAGTAVTITGKNLAALGSVEFGGGTSASFDVKSDKEVVARVPAAATSGRIIVENSVGRFESDADFTVLAPQPDAFEVRLIGDAYTRSNRPTRTVGDASELRVRRSSSAEYNSYLMFEIKGLTASPRKATLKLFVTDGSSNGGDVFLVSNNFAGTSTQWNEADLNFENAPGLDGPPLGSLGSVTTGQIVEFDVTSAIIESGVYSFAMSSKNSDAAIYSSKEGNRAPELVIDSDDNPADDHPPDEIDPPIIASFSPTEGTPGTEVTIDGTSLSALRSVEFSGVSASFKVSSDTRVIAEVPAAGVSGTIVVENSAGKFESEGSFTVLTPEPTEFRITLIGDSYVRSNRATRTVGDAGELRVRRTSSADFNTYLKFEVQGLDESVRRATLRLFVLDGSSEGGAVYSVSNNYKASGSSWDEADLNFENAPTLSGSALSSQRNVSTGQVVEFDVTAAIAGDGIYSFALSNETSDLANYSSKEGEQAPELVIETGEAPSNAPVIASISPNAGNVGTEVTISGENFIGSFNAGSNFQGEIRIMPLGNSLTQGIHGSTDNAGYRNDLDELLNSQRIDFDFVGSKRDGRDFDRHHEGHSGFRADELLAQLKTYLRDNPPDVILLHIGTNDISENQSVSSTIVEIAEVLATINDFDSDIVTILSSVVPRRGSKDGETTRLNRLIEDLVPEKQAAGYNLHYAGNNEAFKANPDWEIEYLADTVHPNDLGYAVMAGVWFDAILDIAGGASSTLTVAFDGRDAFRVSVDSKRQIRATVPAGANSGKVSVTTKHGTALSPTNFDVLGSAALAITLPAGGESWIPGSVHTITWQSADGIDQVNLEYSVDNGSNWQPIASLVSNQGRYIWETPEASSDNVLVRVLDAGPSGHMAVSEGVFALADFDGGGSLLSLNELKQAALGQLENRPIALADVNADGRVDVLDILNTIDFNIDADNRNQLAKNSVDNVEKNSRISVTASKRSGATGLTARIPVSLEADLPIRAFQIKLSYDADQIISLTPEIDPALNMILDFHAEKNVVEILGYLEKEGGAVDVSDVLLTLHAQLATEESEAVVNIVEALFISKSLKVIPLASETTSENSAGIPAEFELFQNYPNPFNAGTQIKFNLPSKSRVSLKIFNLKGELVRTLVDSEKEPGIHRISWTGDNDRGLGVATGVYVYRIKIGKFEDSRKLTFVK